MTEKSRAFRNPTLLNYGFALIWLINGLYCKVLLQVPRHEEIVKRIVGTSYSTEITRLIGVAEIGMFVWIISGKYSRLNAITQITAIAAMNLLEFLLVPDLLLFGRFNLLLACLLIVAVYYDEWKINKQPIGTAL